MCLWSIVNNYTNNIFFIAPTGSPVNVHRQTFNSTVIMLLWTKLPYRQRNGIIRHYAVRVCQIEPYRQCEEHLATGTTLELLLHPHYKYSWTVAAYTVARGPYSQSLPFQMPEDSKCIIRKDCAALLNFSILITTTYPVLRS